MINKLKPCPFCGSPNGKHKRDCWINLVLNEEVTGQALVEPWNTRAERTCQMVFVPEAGMYQCSKCGTYSVTAAYNKAHEKLNYCMGCGAKVVD